MEKNVQLKYRLYRRRNGVFYWQENDSSKQGTLRTTDRRKAERLLNAMNESHRQPTLNLNLARAYLAAHDPRMAQRTWQTVMDEMATHGIPTTQHRCARGFRSKAYDPIRNKPLLQTTGADLLAIIHPNGNCVAHYLPTSQLGGRCRLAPVAHPRKTRMAQNPKQKQKSDHCQRACSSHRFRKKCRASRLLLSMSCFTRPVPPKPMQRI
jgi:hypothetical protein